MSSRSELKGEVQELLAWIEAEQGLALKRVLALNELHAKGEELLARVAATHASRDTVESVGAWMDECEMNS